MWDTLARWVFSYFLMPLFSKAWVAIVEWWQSRKATEARSEAIDEKVKTFKEAPTTQEKEDAFKALIRRPRA